jgi:hypothetical protein
MKTSAVVEAMICLFSATFEVLPSESQHCLKGILNAALADVAIEDADARKLVECFVGKEQEQRLAMH